MIEILFDLETTANGGPTKDSPEAHWPENRVLLAGYKHSGEEMNVHVGSLSSFVAYLDTWYHPITLIAHNLKFDLKYLIREFPEHDWNEHSYYCTMTGAYLESGCAVKFASLESLAPGGEKTMDLGAYLKGGGKMEDIPEKDLITYLKQDVTLLEYAYNSRTDKTPQNYLLPLAKMELTGLHIDRAGLLALHDEQEELSKKATSGLQWYIMSTCMWQDGSPVTEADFCPLTTPKTKCIKPTASRTISFLVSQYPSTLKVTGKWELKHRVPFPIKLGTIPKDPSRGHSITEDILKDLGPVGEKALQERKAHKIIQTYVLPFAKSCLATVDDTVHPKLNTAATGTGRLSSSQPNGQNMPGIIRRLVTPRVKGGALVEVDFKQLEVVAVACTTGDKQLIKDLNAGVDIHYEMGKNVFKWTTPSDMNKSDRTIVKNVVFGSLYGGGKAGISKQTGVAAGIVGEIIKALYDRYPQVKAWQNVMATEADLEGSLDVDEGVRYWTYSHPLTGYKTTYKEQKSPDWLKRRTGKDYSFSPQQLCNYSNQSFGGRIVLEALEYIAALLPTNIHPILTVHDSILLEGEAERPQYLINDLMKQACDYLQKKYKLPVELKFTTTASKESWS